MWQLAQGREAMVRKALWRFFESRADCLLVPYTYKPLYHAIIMLYPH